MADDRLSECRARHRRRTESLRYSMDRLYSQIRHCISADGWLSGRVLQRLNDNDHGTRSTAL